jgi:hypothetical protein
VSDVMLHGILNMPPGIWDNSDIHKAQRHDAYKQASQRIKELETRLQIDTLNPNRREHIVQQAAKIAELQKAISDVLDSSIYLGVCNTGICYRVNSEPLEALKYQG